MDARESEHPRPRSTVERVSECEVFISRAINGPARLVFEAWTKAELFQQWWVPKSVPIKLLSWEVDARVGGRYRLVFEGPGGATRRRVSAWRPCRDSRGLAKDARCSRRRIGDGGLGSERGWFRMRASIGSALNRDEAALGEAADAVEAVTLRALDVA
jgi:hypothetical protein